MSLASSFTSRSHAGHVSVALSAVAMGAIACFLFPEWLTTPALRAVYPLPLVRAAICAALAGAIVAGVADVIARRAVRRAAAAGLALAGVAIALGGPDVPARAVGSTPFALGLDWLLVDLLAMAILFVPLELWLSAPASARRDDAATRTDLAHFAVGHLLVQGVAFFAVAPAERLLAWAVVPSIARAIARQPLPLRVLEVLVVADAAEYVWHRLSHRVPALWRIHAVHHSPERMNWLAASRMHLADVILTRAVVFTPVFLLGFTRDAVGAYLVLVSVHAVLIHADVEVRLGALERFVVTPRYHHWHHASDADAIDTNFALVLPVLDRLFGTQRLPADGAWPRAYGVAGAPLPRGWLGQLLYPFTRRRADRRHT